MVRLKFAWSVLLVAFWISPCAAATTLISNAMLISPERSEPLLDAWVLIEDGVIAAIGDGEAEVPEAEFVDATDHYLIAAHLSRYERLIGDMASDGANLLFGTDTAVSGFGWASPPGLSGYWEMRAWRRAGVTLEQLLRALTLDNARAFHVDDEIGSIEVGKRADLLILESDPLEDVTAYDSIERVILGGRVIERAALRVDGLAR